MVATKQEELQKTFSERIPQLCLMDDEFFCAVFDGDIECTEYVLRIIMGIDNLKVKTAVVQKAEMNLRGRGARFDVLAEADGVYYDIEVQRTDRGAAPRRARFNSSILDTNLLNKGEDFDRLPETYIIFITERDVLKGGLPIYHVNRKIEETNEHFNDGSHIIYVNGENRAETPLGLLMRDFFNRDHEQMNRSILRKRSQYFKTTDMGVKKLSLIMQDIYDMARVAGREEGIEKGIDIGREEGIGIGRKEGIGIGREEGIGEMIIGMLKFNQPVELIAKIANMPVEKIIAIGKERGLVQ